MKKMAILLAAAILLSLPALLINFSIKSSSQLLQIEYEKQLETRLTHDLMAQSQLTGLIAEIVQQCFFFLTRTDQLFRTLEQTSFLQPYKQLCHEFVYEIADNFGLPFELCSAIEIKEHAVLDHFSFKDKKMVDSNRVTLLTLQMLKFVDPHFFLHHAPEDIFKLSELLREIPGLFFNLKYLDPQGYRTEISRMVIRDGQRIELLVTMRGRKNYLINALFDLSKSSIDNLARKRVAQWQNKDAGIVFFGGGSGMTPISCPWFNDKPALLKQITEMSANKKSIIESLKTEQHVVLTTPFDKKNPWQVAIAAKRPISPPHRGMQLLLSLFAIAGCSIWKLLAEKTCFGRSINLSLRTFIIIVFTTVSLLPFIGSVYLTSEYVIANFKVEKNKVAEELSKSLLDHDLSTFSQLRDSLNLVKSLGSIEAIASFTGLPETAPTKDLMIATMVKLQEVKGIRSFSEVWLSSPDSDLYEIEYRQPASTYVFQPNRDVFISQIFNPRFRQFLSVNQSKAKAGIKAGEKISFDNIKGEMLDELVLNMFGEETYYNLQKKLGMLLKLESFLDSNAILCLPITHRGKVAHVFSYVMASAEIRRHFPDHLLNTDKSKPVLITLSGNQQFLNAAPKNLQFVSENLPTLSRLARQSFLTSSRVVMHDANASGSPVFETLPAKYSDYIICGQRNTRSLESINAELTATAARYFALAAVLTLILSLLASLYFTIPIRQLTEAMQKIIREDYSVRLIETHPDEFAISARAFNKMATGLKEGMLLRNFVSESVRDTRTASTEIAEANICQVTVLFSSIKGFAGMQNQLAPEELFAVMQAHLSAAVEIASELGGEIDKMIEDKIMIVFHHVREADTAAVNAAISAAAHIRGRVMATCRHHTAAGINTGEVVSGTMGAASVRLSKTVVGDTVNLAARLASVAADMQHGGIVVSGASVQLATDGRHFQKLPISSVKGKTHSVEAYLA